MTLWAKALTRLGAVFCALSMAIVATAAPGDALAGVRVPSAGVAFKPVFDSTKSKGGRRAGQPSTGALLYTPTTAKLFSSGFTAWNLGTWSLPAAGTDFTIGGLYNLPTSGSYSNDFFAWAMKPAGASLSGVSTLAMGFNNNSAWRGVNIGWSVIGQDDAGVSLVKRNTTGTFDGLAFGGSSALSTARLFASAGSDQANVVRAVFLQRKGAETSIWMVEPGGTPKKYMTAADGFGGIAGQIMVAGGFNGASGPQHFSGNNGNIGIRGMFRIAQAITPAQMAAIANFSDPMQVLSFSAAAGDLYFDMADVTSSAPPAGTTTIDRVQGQAGTAIENQSLALGAAPTAITSEYVRFDNITRGRIIQRSGFSTSASDLPLSGSYQGQDGCSIRAQIVDFTSGTARYPVAGDSSQWATVTSTALGGAWSGTLTGVPVGLFWDDLKWQKYCGATVVASGQLKKQFTIGDVVDGIGQSINEQVLRTGVAAAWPGANVNYLSFFSRAQGAGAYPDAHVQGTNYARGWDNSPANFGYGENAIVGTLSAALGIPAGSAMDAAVGTTIQSWITDTVAGGTADRLLYPEAAKTIAETLPRFVYLQQGHANVGSAVTIDGIATGTSAGWQKAADHVYAQVKATYAAAGVTTPWFFIIVPQPFNWASSTTSAAGQYEAIREAQLAWGAAQVAAEAGGTFGITQHVVIGPNINDMPTVDGIHGAGSNSGASNAGRYGERLGATLAGLNSGVMPSGGFGAGSGPIATDAKWDGARAIDITFSLPSGATALQNPGGAITSASISSTTLTISTIGQAGGSCRPGDTVAGANVTAGTKITAYGTGAGAAGTYTVDTSQTAAAGAITCSGSFVSGFTAYGASGAASPLTLDPAVPPYISGSTTVRMTLSAVPGSPPYVYYQYGFPGLATGTGAETAVNRITDGIDRPVYDNRTPSLNPTLGYPAMPVTNLASHL